MDVVLGGILPCSPYIVALVDCGVELDAEYRLKFVMLLLPAAGWKFNKKLDLDV